MKAAATAPCGERYLGSADGHAALAALIHGSAGAPAEAGPPLIGLDFDGTLAPIVALPQEARVPLPLQRRLRALAERVPVAVVSGRAAADVRARLGFTPWVIVGNHGAEQPGAGDSAAALDGLRQALHGEQGALHEAGVTVEDKGLSIALHYRLARDRASARALIRQLLAAAAPGLRVFGGKMVENVVPEGAPDKADAMRALAAHCRSTRVFFAGDDVNDEPVFRAAPPSWLTVRIGRGGGRSAARFLLAGPGELPWVLDEMLRLLEGAGA